MKKIVMDKPEKVQALQAELDQVQARCTARTLSADDVVQILKSVENALNIPKKAMKDMTALYHGGQHFPKAYKYHPESTHFTATHNGKCWIVVNVCRAECPNVSNNVQVVSMPEEAKKAVINRHKLLYV